MKVRQRLKLVPGRLDLGPNLAKQPRQGLSFCNDGKEVGIVFPTRDDVLVQMLCDASSRQNTLMELGGLLGTFELSGSELATLWPALWWGQWVHTGKGTTFGLGAYRLEVGFVS